MKKEERTVKKTRIFFAIVSAVTLIMFAACNNPFWPEGNGGDPVTGTSTLAAKIADARLLIEAVEVLNETDPANVTFGIRWVTPAEKAALESAIARAEAALATAATQTAVNNAVTALNAAIAEFNGAIKTGAKAVTDADRAALIADAEAAMAGVTISGDGIDVDPNDKWVTQDDVDALREAIDALRNASGQDNINEAYEALLHAITVFNHAKQDGNRSAAALSDRIEDAKQMKLPAYVEVLDETDPAKVAYGLRWVTPDEMEAFEDAIAAAENALANATTQTAINNALEALNAAIEEFEDAIKTGAKAVSGAEVEALLLKAEAERYGVLINTDAGNVPLGSKWVTREEWDALDDAIDALEYASGQANINNAYAALVEAIAVFEDDKKDGAFDNTALSEKIEEAKALKTGVEEIDETDPAKVLTGVRWVTPAQMTAFDGAIAAAESTLATATTMAAVNTAITSLNNAMLIFNAAIQTGVRLPTPVHDDFTIHIEEPQTEGSVSEDAVSITPKTGKSSGAITIWYTGIAPVTYGPSKDVPQEAGHYEVTFDVAASGNFAAATGLHAGTLVINEAAAVDPVTDTDELEAKINAAKALKTGVEINTLATNVFVGTKWVFQADMTLFNNAINAAQNVLDTAETQTAINDAVTALNSAIAAFNLALKNGTKPTLPIPAAGDFNIVVTHQAAGSVSANPVSITPKDGKSTGGITIWYTGASPTTYTKSQTVPTAAGNYNVTFDVAASGGFPAATNLPAGTFMIREYVVDYIIRTTAEWNAAITDIKTTKQNRGTYNLEFAGDIGVPGFYEADPTFGTTPTGQTLTVNLKGNGKLYLTTQGRMFYLVARQNLVLDSNTMRLEGRKIGQNGSTQDNSGAALISVQLDAALVLNNGTIHGNVNNGGGGGVFLNTGGTFTMKGGTISGCGAGNNGGGGVMNNGTFRMSGGTIYGDTEPNASLRNTTTGPGAALNNLGTAQRGTFSNPTAMTGWTSSGNLGTSNTTIRLVNGVLQ